MEILDVKGNYRMVKQGPVIKTQMQIAANHWTDILRSDRPTDSQPNCPFDNDACAVSCECGDIECHRYCLNTEEAADGNL